MERGLLPTAASIDKLRFSIALSRTLFEVRWNDCEAGWQAVDGCNRFDWYAPLPLNGAKSFFFPSRERLLTWNADLIEPATTEPQPFALFGLRACDLTAIAYLDQFFAADACYQRRRAQALLIGVNCLSACKQGFCRDVDAGPFAREGFDLNLTLLWDGQVLVEVGTDLGRHLLDVADLNLVACDSTVDAAFETAAERAAASFADRSFVASAIVRINAEHPSPSEDSIFAAVGPACFACTGCSNLCPTCSCFTIVDEASNGGGERIRYWDSCLLEGFQREASGHHPTPTIAQRVHRFWYHKFGDDFHERFGRVGCVGCGRCDVTCTGSIGALQVLQRLGEQ